MDKKRAGKTIRAQYEIYLNYLQTFLQNCWKELCGLLNSTVGPTRDEDGWKRVFVDWKSQVKRKSRVLDLDKNKTSGGQAEAKPLSDLEERLIGLIGKVVVSGIPDLPEAGVVTEIPDPESPLNCVAPKVDELSSNNGSLKKPLKKVDTNGPNRNWSKSLKNASEEAIENLQRSNSETIGILHNMLTELQGINSGINKLADAMITLAQVGLKPIKHWSYEPDQIRIRSQCNKQNNGEVLQDDHIVDEQPTHGESAQRVDPRRSFRKTTTSWMSSRFNGKQRTCTSHQVGESNSFMIQSFTHTYVNSVDICIKATRHW
ncbi:hypothetical protein GEV33_001637 [Tenebrio molitor]|uniref:Regulatory protein zeste n=1 Tax=Tenebrio molitor TaxID=7067 RepID=A0A8J6LFT2_TENMO|nr:hypothetical protein GEV33_001637 [Tenebrio molitor]